MINLNLKKRTKVIISLVVLASVLAASPFVIYLKVLPYAVSNEHVINFVEKSFTPNIIYIFTKLAKSLFLHSNFLNI